MSRTFARSSQIIVVVRGILRGQIIFCAPSNVILRNARIKNARAPKVMRKMLFKVEIPYKTCYNGGINIYGEFYFAKRF